MSRRKQRKPQQLISDCDNSTSSENGDTAGEDIQVCRKCCAQFDEPSDFARHKQCCSNDNQVVVIVENQEESGKSYVTEGSASNNITTGKKIEVTEQCDMEMGEMRADMGKKGIGPSQRFLIPNGGLIMDGLTGPKIGMAPVSQEDVSGGQTTPGTINIPMILEELRVLQQRQIHQMQITEQICQQVLMLGSLSMSPLTQTTPQSLGSKSLHVTSPSKQSQPVPESPKSISGDENAKQPLLHLYDPIVQSFNVRNIPNVKDKFMAGFYDKPSPGHASLPSSPPCHLISPHAIFPPGLSTLQGGLFLGARVLDTAPSLLKQKNSEPMRSESQQERTSGRHKCRFCAKVFGSDSALQIHLRSHTGERPYKCNICGNRFTTRGNLKVHFHRHREKYPHIQMNPHPVPEHLDYVLTSTGLPYGMSVPPEKMEEETIEKKPFVPPVFAPESLFSSSTTQVLPSIGKLVLMKPGEAASTLKGPSFPKTKVDENTPPGERSDTGAPAVSGRMQLSKLVTSLPSWALLASHFKPGTFPFSYTVDPLGYSETSKLQQLVEKIDKQAAIPNQCVICLRVLSCPRALRLHYNQHGGERPFKCKICGRAFSTKGNLKAHFVSHKSSLSSKPQNSCPICQKKFTNAVTLQQHIRMHLGGQIPNGELSDAGGNKTEDLEDKGVPDFSDEVSTDEESLDVSESENEKTALVDCEVSIMEDDTATTVASTNTENNINSSTTHILNTTKESITSSEPNIASEPVPEIIPNSKTNVQAGNDEEYAMNTDSSKSPQNKIVKASDDENDTGIKQDSEHTMSNKQEGCLPETTTLKCSLCSEILPNGESLDHHSKCHMKDGLFHCLVCKQSFLEASILKKHVIHAHQVHMSTHVWSSNNSRRGRRLSLDNIGPLLSGTPVKLQEFLSKEIPTQLVGVSPLSFWNQYTAYLTSSPLPTSGSLASTGAILPSPALLALRTAKAENIAPGELAEVTGKKNGNTESPCNSLIKEEK
ncbi:sal-like protein 2 isoform X2 [Spea bombifrons]|uniref:sal-like protein 2 isoform X2 n=1 Tax=Spea bombifrons TaxID=233779 RepID=UPI00234AC056|nr:sal-like protein 2 isoform X2 [Spea bombifrons]